MSAQTKIDFDKIQVEKKITQARMLKWMCIKSEDIDLKVVDGSFEKQTCSIVPRMTEFNVLAIDEYAKTLGYSRSRFFALLIRSLSDFSPKN